MIGLSARESAPVAEYHNGKTADERLHIHCSCFLPGLQLNVLLESQTTSSNERVSNGVWGASGSVHNQFFLSRALVHFISISLSISTPQLVIDRAFQRYYNYRYRLTSRSEVKTKINRVQPFL